MFKFLQKPKKKIVDFKMSMKNFCSSMCVGIYPDLDNSTVDAVEVGALREFVRKQTNPEFGVLKHMITFLVSNSQINKYLISKRDFYINSAHPTGSISVSDLRCAKNSMEKKLVSYFEWDPFKKGFIDPNRAFYNTLNYLFKSKRCGIYVRIQHGVLVMFVPFVNPNFRNNWDLTESKLLGSSKVCDYKSLSDYYNDKKEVFRKEQILPLNKWWANAGVFCNEYSTQLWGDHLLGEFKHLFQTLCSQRKVPDCEFFLNKRDLPQLKRDLTCTHSFMFGEKILLKEASDPDLAFTPIVSPYTGEDFADFAFPLAEDWRNATQLLFSPNYINPVPFLTEWHQPSWDAKQSVAIFRGSCTGAGVTPQTNQRLALALFKHKRLNAKLTSWGGRDKKIGNLPMSFMDSRKFPFLDVGKHNFMTLSEQFKRYKYLLYVEGHSASNRLGALLGSGCVVIIVKTLFAQADKLWFSTCLKPFENFVPVKEDLSDLSEILDWCAQNDLKCQQIAKNALKLHKNVLSVKGILDYAHFVCCNISAHQKKLSIF